MATLRASFDGRVLVPIGPVDLPTGRVLEFDVREPAEPVIGSPEFVRRAMREMLPLDSADVRAMEHAIDDEKLPVRHEPIFDDDGEGDR